MSTVGLVPVACPDERCAHQLGMIGASMAQLRVKPVWRIQPGWAFRKGILEFIDHEQRSERLLAHETFGLERQVEGLRLAREADLPICVRCPRCHRLRWVVPDLYYKRIAS